MKNVAPFLVLIVLALAIAGCAPGANEMANSPNAAGEVAGFWPGLWHGFIALFTFIGSLFSDAVNVYEPHNNGGWYNFGFVLGVSFFFGGSGGGASRWK
jgi:hypothetical protein